MDDAADRWRAGWALGGAVVLIAAALLVTIIGYARRITAQAGEIEEAIRGARDHTAPLFDLAELNASLERLSRRLGRVGGRP